MTIARRLTALLALPLLVLFALGVFSAMQLAKIETNSRFLSETQIGSLAALGDISRSFAEMRVNLRSALLTEDKAAQARAEALYREDEQDLDKSLNLFGDSLISDEKDRRLFNDFRRMSTEWNTEAKKLISMAASGRRLEAVGAIASGPVPELGVRLSKLSAEWIKHNEFLAENAGRENLAVIDRAQRNLLISIVGSLLLTGILGFLTFRGIVNPIRALQASVETIAAGDYVQAVPFIKATDETGSLARSIDVLKHGASAMEEQRWIKTNAAQITSELQGSTSLPKFGEQLLSGLVPVLGGGVASFYLMDKGHEHLHRIASYGRAAEASGADMFQIGDGLVGECARARRAIALTDLPPNYVRISSGVGGAAPVQTVAWPVMSREAAIGVLEIASFRALTANEKALLEELLPVVGMSLEILLRNVATQELLAQTQEQARQLEEQTEELTQSTDELLSQKEELLAQQDELTAQREQLKASEERSRLILESSAEGIFGTDTEGRITFVNPAACHMLGFSPDELLGRPSHATFHSRRPDGRDYPKEECPMFLAYTQGKHSRVDDELLWRKDGAGLAVEYGATPVLKDGTVVGAVVSFTDITERRRAEERLRETEQFFRSVLELAPDALMVVGSNGVIELANAQCEKLFGYTRDELIGQKVEMLVPANIRPGHPALREGYHREPVTRGMGTERELRAARKDGSEIPVEIGLAPIPGRQAEGLRVAVSVRDITLRREQEKAILEAKQKAEEATQAKSMFLANMSHEIRTPMNAIIGMTHLALKTELTPKQRDYLTKVRGAAGALLGIINDILDFSKIEAGRLDIESADFGFEDVLNNFSTVVGQKAQEKDLEFLISAQPDIPPNLVGDPLRLGQILVNLVNNSVKFTERGEVIVSVGVEEQIAGRVKLKFSVRDTGIGMTPEQSARLFQAFSQADTSTTRKFGGTGLGLSISKRLVELMGGNIWVESELGVGSTFFFTAWFGVGSAEVARNRFIPVLAGIRALVVDDNAQAREILSDALLGFALRAETVSSGEKAIGELAAADTKDPFQLVLMDWNMPGMDGLQASALIKRGGRLKNIPRIVMVTAFGREDVRSQAEEIGVDGYLLKPVNASMLYDTLMDLFGVEGTEHRATRQHGGGSEYNARGVRILLVEDNAMNQQVATELLESAGAAVSVADNGAIAVKLLREGPQPPPFDIVLMDLQMPEMDGHTATRLLRADPRFKDLPIVAMTAHALVEERQRCLESGMNDHVTKPIDPDALFAALARWTKPSTIPAPAPVAPKPSAGDVVVPEIEGIDIGGALKRVAGNKRLYRSLLEQFADKQSATGAQITAALEAGDRALAERLAHTVKGIAGNIGVESVRSAASKIERGIKDGDASVPALLTELETVMGLQVEAIRRALAGTVPKGGGAAEFNAEAARAAVERLNALLAENDGDASEAVEAVAETLAGRVDAQRIGDLRAAISEFDFDRAALKLSEIAMECNLMGGAPI